MKTFGFILVSILLSLIPIKSIAQTCEENRAQAMAYEHSRCQAADWCNSDNSFCETGHHAVAERFKNASNSGYSLVCWGTVTMTGTAPYEVWSPLSPVYDCPNTPQPPPPPGGPGGGGGGGPGGPPCQGACCDTPNSGVGVGGPPGSSEKKGSIISVESQSIAEIVPITGSTFGMVYNSLYQKGRIADFKIRLPVVGTTPRDYITSFAVQLKRGSTVVDTATFSNSTANQTYEYTWNGLDSSGVSPVDSASFVLNLSETSPAGTWPFPTKYLLSHFDASRLGLGGWMPESLLHYDVQAKRVYAAVGSYREVEAQPFGSGQLYVSSESGSEVYVFDANGIHIQTKTGLLGTTVKTFAYDGSGRLVSVTEPFGKVTYFNRNLSGDLYQIVAPNGQVTSVSVDANGYLESITNPNSESYQFTYYGTQGMMNTFGKPNGEVSTFYFDSDGLLTKDAHSGGYFTELVNALNSAYTYSFNLLSPMSRTTAILTQVTPTTISSSETLPSGANNTKYFEDVGGSYYRSDSGEGYTREITSTVDPRFGSMAKMVGNYRTTPMGGSPRDVAISSSITLSTPTDPFSISSWSQTSSLTGTSSSMTTTFNPSTKKFNFQTYLGKTAEVEIDAYERVVSQKVGSLNPVTITYTNEKVTGVARGSNSTSIGYNLLGQVNSVTNALSQSTGYVYDNAGRVSSVVLPDSRVVGYSYDGNGNVTGVTPPSKPIHVLEINPKGLLGAYKPPTLSGVTVVNTSYDYNLDNQLTDVAYPDGGYRTYSYNSTTGVLDSINTPNGMFYYYFDTARSLPNYIITPDNVSSQISYVGRSPSYFYNDVNGTSAGSYSISFDSFGRKDTDTVTQGGTGSTTSAITYLYNDDQELRKAGDVEISYHVPNAYVTGTTMGTGSTGFSDTYTYNTNGEVTGYVAKRGTTTIYNLTLTRDSIGRIIGKSQTMNSLTDAFVYTFDSTGRITQTDKNSSTVATYTYDNNSNRNGGTIGAQPTTATYDDQDRMLTYNTLSFTYNANGDLTSKTNSTTSQTTTYTYDVFGNLRQVFVPPSTTITYEIDGLNRRIGKRVNGTLQKRWVYQDKYKIAAELNSSGAITKRFIYGSKKNIPDYMIASGVKYRIISDHLGSPRLVVKQSDGSITQRMNHDEFGRVTEDTNPGYLPFGFAGGLYDNQTGLVRFGARDFDSETGRWTSKDPIRFKGGDVNLYGYVTNDPINWIDPRGTSPNDVMQDWDQGGEYTEPKSCPGWRALKAWVDFFDGPSSVWGYTLPKDGILFANFFTYGLSLGYNPTEEEKMQCGCMDEN